MLGYGFWIQWHRRRHTYLDWIQEAFSRRFFRNGESGSDRLVRKFLVQKRGWFRKNGSDFWFGNSGFFGFIFGLVQKRTMRVTRKFSANLKRHRARPARSRSNIDAKLKSAPRDHGWPCKCLLCAAHIDLGTSTSGMHCCVQLPVRATDLGCIAVCSSQFPVHHIIIISERLQEASAQVITSSVRGCMRSSHRQ